MLFSKACDGDAARHSLEMKALATLTLLQVSRISRGLVKQEMSWKGLNNGKERCGSVFAST